MQICTSVIFEMKEIVQSVFSNKHRQQLAICAGAGNYDNFNFLQIIDIYGDAFSEITHYDLINLVCEPKLDI
jgi:hypothetical protein